MLEEDHANITVGKPVKVKWGRGGLHVGRNLSESCISSASLTSVGKKRPKGSKGKGNGLGTRLNSTSCTIFSSQLAKFALVSDVYGKREDGFSSPGEEEIAVLLLDNVIVFCMEHTRYYFV